jgi:Cu-Zn family superoxide dismutase
MNRRASLAAAVALTALAVAAVAPRVIRLSGAEAATPVVATRAQAALVAPDGRTLGSATLEESTRGVLIRVDARGLPPGRHGFHIHAKGDCGDAKFERAGGHLHVGPGSVHGLLNAQATDTGDLPNLVVPADGRLEAEVFSSFVTLGGDSVRAALLDKDGAALVLHARPTITRVSRSAARARGSLAA